MFFLHSSPTQAPLSAVLCCMTWQLVVARIKHFTLQWWMSKFSWVRHKTLLGVQTVSVEKCKRINCCRLCVALHPLFRLSQMRSELVLRSVNQRVKWFFPWKFHRLHNSQSYPTHLLSKIIHCTVTEHQLWMQHLCSIYCALQHALANYTGFFFTHLALTVVYFSGLFLSLNTKPEKPFIYLFILPSIWANQSHPCHSGIYINLIRDERSLSYIFKFSDSCLLI